MIINGLSSIAATANVIRWRCPPDTSFTLFAYNSCSKPNSSKQAYNLFSEKGTERFTFSSNGRVTISFTHSNGSANSWGIHAICRRTTSMVDISSNVPPTWMVPSLNGTNPITAFNNEVFPQPDCPTMQAVSPCSRFRLKPEKSTSVPKAIQALLICNMTHLSKILIKST